MLKNIAWLLIQNRSSLFSTLMRLFSNYSAAAITFYLRRPMTTYVGSASHMSRDLELQATEPRYLELKTAYESVKKTIADESQKHPSSGHSVELVAVSKYMPASDIQVLYDLGHRHFGENYVQELTNKAHIVRQFYSP